MGELVTAIFSTFSEVMEGLSEGLTISFNHLLYDHDATGALTENFSPLVLFIFTVAGIGLAAGLLWKIFGLIKGSSHKAG